MFYSQGCQDKTHQFASGTLVRWPQSFTTNVCESTPSLIHVSLAPNNDLSRPYILFTAIHLYTIHVLVVNGHVAYTDGMVVSVLMLTTPSNLQACRVRRGAVSHIIKSCMYVCVCVEWIH